MGVNVELRRQGAAPRRGRVPTTTLATVVDADDIFSGLLDKCHKSGLNPILDKIDPYANTTVQGSDMKKFIQELSILARYAESDAEKRQLACITALAEKCSAHGESHQLHFVGD